MKEIDNINNEKSLPKDEKKERILKINIEKNKSIIFTDILDLLL